MEFLPKKLVKEWSWRVDNGMPDYRNHLHLIELKNLLIERKFPHEFVDGLLGNLRYGEQIPGLIYEAFKGKTRQAAVTTDIIETAACAGLYVSGIKRFQALLTDKDTVVVGYKSSKAPGKIYKEEFKTAWKEIIKRSTSALKVLQTALKNGKGDWNSRGKSEILNLIPPSIETVKGKLMFFENNLMDIIACCGCAWGMYEFKSQIPFSSHYTIHGGIEEFYKTEKSLGMTRKGAKKATPDAIIANVSKDKLIAALKSGEVVTGDESRGIVTIGKNIKYLQASLKKSVDGAQLGKIATFLRTNHGFGLDVDASTKAISKDEKEKLSEIAMTFESEDEFVKELLSEGFWEKIKDFATSAWTSLKNKFNSAIRSFKDKWFKKKAPFTTTFNKLTKGYTIKEFTETEGELIREYLETGNELLLEGTMSDDLRATILEIQKNPAKLYKNLNKEFDKCKAAMNSLVSQGAGAEFMKKLTNIPKKIPINPDELSYTRDPKNKKKKKLKVKRLEQVKGGKVIINLVANFAVFTTLTDMAKDAKKLRQITSALGAEMVFGGTKMPVWKVYGKFTPGGDTHKYLGTMDMVEKRIEGGIPDIPVLGVKTYPNTKNPAKNPYYVTVAFVIMDVTDKNEIVIAKCRTGGNSTSTIAVVFEGTTAIGPFKLKDFDMLKIMKSAKDE